MLWRSGVRSCRRGCCSGAREQCCGETSVLCSALPSLLPGSRANGLPLRAPCAPTTCQAPARSGAAEMDKAQLPISAVHAASWRKPMRKRNGRRGFPAAAVTNPTNSVTSYTGTDCLALLKIRSPKWPSGAVFPSGDSGEESVSLHFLLSRGRPCSLAWGPLSPDLCFHCHVFSLRPSRLALIMTTVIPSGPLVPSRILSSSRGP